jgi:hypothetical protein
MKERKPPKSLASPARSLGESKDRNGARPARPVNTIIEGVIDVGYGNKLFIRGEGGGLSWVAGQPMQCVGESKWVWTSTTSLQLITFKLLLNDQVWAVGDKATALPGKTTTLTPAF